MLTMAMTAPTPMMMPSTVSTVRILFRRRARKAILKVESTLMALAASFFASLGRDETPASTG